jgi:hypothetical protein
VGTDDNSKEVISMKEEIKEMEEALSDFSIGNFEKSHAAFHKLQLKTSNHQRSIGYQFMTDYSKRFIANGVPENWDGSFEINSK